MLFVDEAAQVGPLLLLFSAGERSFDLLAVALAFGAAATYTVYILVADAVVHRVSPLVLSTWVMIGASLALAVRAVVTGGVDLGFGLDGWLWVTAIAVLSTVVGMFAFFAGLRRTGPTTAAILSTFEPVVTAALAAFVLHEVLTPVQLAGGLLVLSSVALLQLRPRVRRNARSIGAGAPGPARARLGST